MDMDNIVTIRSFPQSWLIIWLVTRVTRRLSLVALELHTLKENLSSPTVLVRVRGSQSLVLCVVFNKSLFVLFLLIIVLSVLRFTPSDYPFSILDLPLQITPLWYLRFTPSDYHFGILDLRLQITPLVS